jgi:hypothetical protein
MSCWLCSEEHINLIANAANIASDPLGTDLGDPAMGRSTFKLLLAENLRSIEARYPGRDFVEEWKRTAARFRYRQEDPKAISARALGQNERAIGPQAVNTLLIKQCDCFDYQACETDDYHTTQAAALVERVRQAAIERGGEQDDGKSGSLYDNMPWGID